MLSTICNVCGIEFDHSKIVRLPHRNCTKANCNGMMITMDSTIAHIFQKYTDKNFKMIIDPSRNEVFLSGITIKAKRINFGDTDDGATTADRLQYLHTLLDIAKDAEPEFDTINLNVNYNVLEDDVTLELTLDQEHLDLLTFDTRMLQYAHLIILTDKYADVLPVLDDTTPIAIV